MFSSLIVKQDGPCPLLQILKICCYNSDLPPQILEAENVPRVCDKLCPSLPATCVEFLAAGSPPGLQGLTAGFAGGSCWPHVWSQGLSCPSQAAGSSPPPLAWPFPHGWKCPGSAAGGGTGGPSSGMLLFIENRPFGKGSLLLLWPLRPRKFNPGHPLCHLSSVPPPPRPIPAGSGGSSPSVWGCSRAESPGATGDTERSGKTTRFPWRCAQGRALLFLFG